MSRKAIIAKNSTMGLVSQGLTILFTFVTRSLFINYIGMELLALNSTFLSILSTLSLAELGFQSAIVYSLYKPLNKKDTKEINDIMNILKIVYQSIGVFFIIVSIIILPCLKYILKGVVVTKHIYLYFILQMLASAFTYFLAYKRALLYADQKDYISKFIDMIINIVFNILQCVIIIIYNNYIVYLVLKILQVICSNILVHIYCSKHYKYLVKTKFNYNKFIEIWNNVKNVFAGKIAGFIYTSTDNLIISSFVNTLSVGYLTNYTTITKSLNGLILSVLNPVAPVIGNYIAENDSDNGKENIFLLYTHVRYLIALFIIVPIIILIEDFIVLWVGNYLLSKIVVLLLSVDFYISIVHSATLDFINGSGLFKISKNIEFIGAFINISLSLFLVNYLGIEGVLIGTVISQIFFWIGRAGVVYRYCFGNSSTSRYILNNIIYILVFIIGIIICSVIYGCISLHNMFFKFIVGGLITETILFTISVFVFRNNKEQKLLYSILLGIIKK